MADERGRDQLLALRELLGEADRRLARKLQAEGRRFGALDARFTGAQALAYSAQIRLALDRVQARILGLTEQRAGFVLEHATSSTARLLAGLERRFTGVAITPRIAEADAIAGITRQTTALMLPRYATSVDRYGSAMIGEFQRRIAVGLVGGMTQEEMIEELTGHGGPAGEVSLRARVVGGQVVRTQTEQIPEGLFRRYRSWAERIVRTETAAAYNEAKLRSLGAMQADMPDVRKKIVAIFDNRTAEDSVAVHGQVRKLDESFRDGAGRVYLRPPARPNDRETLIPWRESWPETRATRQLTGPEVLEVQRRLGTADVRPPQRALVTAEERREAARVWRASRRAAEAEAQRRGRGLREPERVAEQVPEEVPQHVRAPTPMIERARRQIAHMEQLARERAATMTPEEAYSLHGDIEEIRIAVGQYERGERREGSGRQLNVALSRELLVKERRYGKPPKPTRARVERVVEQHRAEEALQRTEGEVARRAEERQRALEARKAATLAKAAERARRAQERAAERQRAVEAKAAAAEAKRQAAERPSRRG